MLFRAFSTNKEIVMFLLPFIAVAYWWLPMVFGEPVDPVPGAPLYDGINYLIPDLLLLKVGIAAALVVVQAILLNRMLIRHEYFSTMTYLPALLFVLLSALYPLQLSFNPLIWANLFIILVLRELLGIYRQESAKTNMFNAGFFLSVATLFFMPVVFAVPVLFIALVIIRPFMWREWALALIGYGLPLLFTWTWYYVTQTSYTFSMMVPDFGLIQRAFETNNELVGNILLGIIAFATLMSFFHFAKVRSRETRRQRKLMTLFAIFSLLLYVAYLGSCISDNIQARFGIMMIPMAIFFTYPLVNARRKWITYFVFYALFITSIVNHYLHYSGS